MNTLNLIKGLTLISSLNVVFLTNPVKVRITLLIVRIAIFLSLIIKRGESWFPILFSMLFIGGILIIFIILSSISPNEKSIKLLFLSIPVIILIILTFQENKILENREIHKFPKRFLDSRSRFSFIILILILYFFSAIIILSKVETPMRRVLCCHENLIL